MTGPVGVSIASLPTPRVDNRARHSSSLSSSSSGWEAARPTPGGRSASPPRSADTVVSRASYVASRFDDLTDGFVPEHGAGAYLRNIPLENVQVRPADGDGVDTDDHVAGVLESGVQGPPRPPRLTFRMRGKRVLS